MGGALSGARSILNIRALHLNVKREGSHAKRQKSELVIVSDGFPDQRVFECATTQSGA